MDWEMFGLLICVALFFSAVILDISESINLWLLSLFLPGLIYIVIKIVDKILMLSEEDKT